MVYSLLNDENKAKDVMTALHNQHLKPGESHWTVETPCCHIHIEVPKAQTDTYIRCECGKNYLLTHSKVSNKLYGE